MGAQLLLLGIIGGTLGGLLGVGGGTIYVPVLVIFYHLSQQTAQGIALAVMIPMSLLGGYAYMRKGSVRSELLRELILGSVLGAVLGAGLATALNGILLRRMFSLVLIVLGTKMLLERQG
jgi:uncharacterized membrane protein YfcA